MDYPKRKRIRLPGFDYSSAGAYFVTICTHERRCILSEILVGAIHESPAVRLTAVGCIVRQNIDVLSKRFPGVTVDHAVIMPNHIHLLIRIDEERALREAPLRGKRPLLSKVIGYLKMNSSKQIHFLCPDLSVWQRGYYEHVVRNERDYQDIWNYIEGNPGKWTEDRYYNA